MLTGTAQGRNGVSIGVYCETGCPGGSMSVVGSAIAVTRLDKEVRRVTMTYPEEDPITLADHMVRMCEEEVLDW